MGEPANSGPARRDAVRFVLIALSILLMPFPLLLGGAVSADGLERAFLLVSDVPLLAVAAVAIPEVVRAIRTRSAGAGLTLAIALALAFTISFALQPSLHGVQVLGRVLGLLGLAAAIPALPSRFERPIVVLVCAVAIAQTLMAVAQVANGGPLGLTLIGETPDPLYARGTALAPRGTMTREYALLLLGLVAGALAVGQAAIATGRGRWAWRAVAAVCAIPLGVTFSRDAVGGVALGAAAQLADRVGRRRPAALALAAFVGAGAIAGGLDWQGWSDRVDQVLVNRPGDAPTDRQTLARQALALVVERPLLGVGTGRYEVAVLRDAATGTNVGPDWSPHDIPLWVAAETGVPAAVVITVLLAVVGVRAWRSGPSARFLFFVVLPFWIFDDLVLTHDQGIVLTGVWLAMLDRYGSSM